MRCSERWRRRIDGARRLAGLVTDLPPCILRGCRNIRDEVDDVKMETRRVCKECGRTVVTVKFLPEDWRKWKAERGQ